MANGVMVFIEARQGAVKKTSLEALSAGRKLADSIQEQTTAVCIGADGPLEQLAHFGADKVLRARHDLLDAYSTEGYASTIAQAAERIQPRIILGSASAMGRDLLPRVAARLRVGLAQDCTEARIVDQQLECVRPIYAGKAFARVRLTRVPSMATLRPNVFSLGAPETSRRAEPEDFAPDLSPGKIRARATGMQASGGQKVELTEANIIVSGGRGLKGPENFAHCPGSGGRSGRGHGSVKGRCRCGLDRSSAPGRTDGEDSFSHALRCLWHQRGHPAPGRYVFLQVYCRD